MEDTNGQTEENHESSTQRFKSIRRSSFADTYYDIKEEVSDEGSDISSLGASKQPIEQEDDLLTSDLNTIEKSNRSFTPFDDVDLSGSRPVLDAQRSESSFDIDSTVLAELEASSRRTTLKRSNVSSAQYSDDPKVDNDDEQHTQNKAPPEFPTRRKGSMERRMLLKAGLGMRAANERIARHTMFERRKSPMSDEDDFSSSFAASTRRNSTGSTVRGKRMSMESLASFSSAASATSGEGVEVGNITFVTDIEMLSIMYGNSDDDSDGGGRATYSSLPPSAILGKGATSMVRLAWRKSKNPEDHRRSSMDTLESTSSMEETETEKVDTNSFRNLYQPQGKKKSRRSIIRVVSQPISDAGSEVSAKGDLVAVKLIQKSVLKQMKTMTKDAKNRVTVQTAFDNIEREIAMMKRLQHPNLVRLFEVIDSVESDKLYMVLEYVSLGEILSHQEGTDEYRRMRYKKKVKGLTPEGHFDEENAAFYFVDIMHGLAYLHRHGICHRDLKPENILLAANGIAKISDFGVAHVFDNEKDDAIRDSLCMSVGSDFLDESERSMDADFKYLSRRESDSAVKMQSQHNSGILNKTEGTWCFWSPEMCGKNSQFSGYSADMWAAGICLFIFTTGKVPFFSMAPLTLFEMIAKAEVPYDQHPNMSSTLKELLQKMLTKNPADRAGVGYCLQHDFCKNARIERIKQLGKDFDRSDHDIVLSNEEVDGAFSVTKPSSMFDKKKKREHDVAEVEGIQEANTEDDDSNDDQVPQTVKPKKKSFLRQRSTKVIKHLSESAIGSTSRNSDCTIQ